MMVPPRHFGSSGLATGFACLVGMTVIGVAIGVDLSEPVFPVDDAYIVIHNAKALLDGYDLNFPGVSPLRGATSAVHLLAVAALSLVMPILWASFTMSIAAATLFVIGLIRLAQLHGANRPQIGLFVVAAATAGHISHQTFNGLETGLAMAVLVWLMVFFETPGSERGWRIPALAGLMPWIRPELAAVSGAIVGMQLFRQWRARDRQPPRYLWTLGIAAMCFVPIALWYWVETGAPFPSTIRAKAAYFAQSCYTTEEKLRTMSKVGGIFLTDFGLMTVGALLLPFSTLGRIGLVFFAAFATAYYMRFPGGLLQYGGRYTYILLPFLLLGLVRWLGDERRWVRRSITALLVVAVLIQLNQFPDRRMRHTHTRNFTRRVLTKFAVIVERKVPPDAKILIHDAGFLPLYLDNPMVDMVGLKSPSSVAVHEKWTLPTCGRHRPSAIEEIARTQSVAYLAVHKQWDAAHLVSEALRFDGWAVEPMIENRPRFTYRLFKLTPPTSTTQSP
jgi:hypothetical protein